MLGRDKTVLKGTTKDATKGTEAVKVAKIAKAVKASKAGSACRSTNSLKSEVQLQHDIQGKKKRLQPVLLPNSSSRTHHSVNFP